MFWQEIVAFSVMLGVTQIITPQNASLITVYGSAFLVILAILKAIFGIKTPLLQKVKAKPEKYDKFANDDENLDKMSEDLKGVFETMKEIFIKSFYLLGRLLKLGWLNKFTTLTNITLLTVYYEYVNELFDNYTPWSKQFNIWLGVYSFILIIGLLGANGYGFEPINKALSRIYEKKLKGLIAELQNVNVKEALRSLTTLDFEINKNKLLSKLEKGRKLLTFLQPIIKEQTYNEWKSWIDKVAIDIDEFEKEQFKKQLEKFGYPVQPTPQQNTIKIHQ